MLIEHGGRLRQAATRYGIPHADWLDLSTGINPNGWKVPSLPEAVWARLPEGDDGLEQAACEYYGTEHLLAVAGSQAAIQALPMLRPPCRVSVIDPGYAEHGHAWRRNGHTVLPVTLEQVNVAVVASDVLVLIHPNNPTGACFSVDQLLDWHMRLTTHGGWLVVDEAFMDCTPEHSLARYCSRPGLIVLRSLGKFFGLAGARVGFVCAQAELLGQLMAALGPWTVSAPARYIATAALQDRVWQQGARWRLGRDSKRLHALLTRHALAPDGGCTLFQHCRTPQAERLHHRLAHQGILTRLFNHPSSLRFGLPGSAADWDRLDRALALVNGASTHLAAVNT